MPRPRAVALTTFVLAAALGAQDAPRLVLHFDDPAFENAAKAVIQRVWATALDALPLEGKRGTIHVYNDVVRNQEIAQKHGQKATQSSPGFVDEKGNAAHVLFWRDGYCRDAASRIGTLTMQLALANVSPLEPQDMPTWFEHGIAAWAEGIDVQEKGWVEPRAHMTKKLNSVASIRMAGARLPKLRAILMERTGTVRDDQAIAAHRIAFHFLMNEHRAATCIALKGAAPRASRAEVREAFLDGLRQSLGEELFEALDEQFRDHVKSLPETLDLEIYPEPDGNGTRGEDDFVPMSPAIMWLDENKLSKFVVTAEPQLVQVGQGDFVFERRKGKWIRVTILGQAGKGSVHVTERVMTAGKPSGWTVLAATKRDVKALRLGSSAPIELRVTRGRLTIKVDRKQVLSLKLPKGSMAGRYGVGGPFGNQVAWRRVRLRKG